MRDLNKIMLMGNVGGEPDMQFTASGAAVARFRLAVNRRRGGAEGGERAQEQTEWFTVVAWNKLAETCNQYVTKGQRVYVEGRLETRTWEGRDGQKRTEVSVVASDVLFLERRTRPYGEAGGPDMEGDDLDPEDLPF